MIDESIRDSLRRQLLETVACPIRTMLCGGMSTSGGYRVYTEYEVGAGRIAEAVHCILGSLGKRAGGRPGWSDVYAVESGHIHEENGLIQKHIREYQKSLYVDHLLSSPYAEESVKSIKRASASLQSRAEKALSDWKQQKDVPHGLKEVGVCCYQVLINLAIAMRKSVKHYPSKVISVYRSNALEKSVANLNDAVKSFLKTAKKIHSQVYSKAKSSTSVEPTDTVAPVRQQQPDEEDVDYIMHLLGI